MHRAPCVPFSSPQALEDLHDLIATSQVHSHRTTCYKKTRGNKSGTQCRFHFPFKVQDRTTIEADLTGDVRKMQVFPRRNHSWINRFNPYPTLSSLLCPSLFLYVLFLLFSLFLIFLPFSLPYIFFTLLSSIK